MLFLRPRVKILVRFFQVCVGDMRVDLRGRNVGVAKHLLDGADVCAVLDQMRRERMPQRMRRDAFEAASFAISLYE